MQAVILAAGRGTRMGDLTDSTPKAMLKIAGKNLIEYKLDALPQEVDEVILVIGYLGGVIHDYFGGIYKDKHILYVEQEMFNGSAGALWCTKDILQDRFLVMMGDDLYAPEDVAACAAFKDGWALVVQKMTNMQSGGNVVIDTHNSIISIAEGEHEGPGFAGTNLFSLDTRIFDIDMVQKSEGSEEFGLPQTAVAASKKLGIPFTALPALEWIQISAPEDLAVAETRLQ